MHARCRHSMPRKYMTVKDAAAANVTTGTGIGGPMIDNGDAVFVPSGSRIECHNVLSNIPPEEMTYTPNPWKCTISTPSWTQEIDTSTMYLGATAFPAFGVDKYDVPFERDANCMTWTGGAKRMAKCEKVGFVPV